MTIGCRYRSALALLLRKSLPGTTACILKDSIAWKNTKCSEMVRKDAIPKVRKTTVYDHYNFMSVIYTILCQMTSIISYIHKRLIPWMCHLQDLKTSAFSSKVSVSSPTDICLANSTPDKVVDFTSIWSLYGWDTGMICWGITVLFFWGRHGGKQPSVLGIMSIIQLLYTIFKPHEINYFEKQMNNECSC